MSLNAKLAAHKIIMVNEAIVEGIKQAMNNGQSLKQAMESFYYAGYPKEEIEAAARIVQGAKLRSASKQPISQEKKKFSPKPLKPKTSAPIQKVSNYPPEKPKTVLKKDSSLSQKKLTPKTEKTQRTSNYQRQDTRPGVDWVLIIMLLVLAGLIGILLFIIFKAEIMNFLSS